MEEVIFEYISEKAVEDLRHSKLSEDVADVLNFSNWLAYLRKFIKSDDKNWLIELAKTDSHTAELCINLMMPVKNDEDVKKYLFNRWTDASKNIKMQLVWRLTDYPDLSDDTHKDIYKFVCTNWDDWCVYTVKRFGFADKAIEICKRRLGNRSYMPETKEWLYLCLAAGSNNKSEAKKIIEPYVTSQSGINAMVAKDLLKSLDK